MAELKGSLSGIGLPAIVQLIGELHHSGTLELSKGETSGWLGFDDGRLVSAAFEGDEGATALSACVLELAEGEFRFVEGVARGERTLDTGGADLQRLLMRISTGEDVNPIDQSAASAQGDSLEPTVCPRLGFADDPMRNYARPTALHRCFASIAPSLVTVQEQRELCLGGRYPTCPRFRNASRAKRAMPPITTTSAPVVAPPVAIPVAASAPPPAPHPVATPAPAAQPVVARGPAPQSAASPPAVMPRLAAAPAPTAAVVETMPAIQPGLANGTRPRVAPSPASLPEPPIPTTPSASASPLAVDDEAAPRSQISLRDLVLVALGIIAGLILLGLAVVFLRPAFFDRPVAQPSAIQAVEPLATSTRVVAATPAVVATRVPVVVAGAAAAASPAATSVAAVRPVASPTASPARANVAAAGQTLLDVRFASGMPQNWVDNAPYAAWSDGAYRLQAHQAAQFVAVSAPVQEPVGDVVVSATFRKTGGPPGGGYGILVRDQGPGSRDGVSQNFRAYVFETGDLGEFGVWRRDGDHWFDLVPWTRSSAIRPGGSPNELIVRATGDRLVFTVNSFEVANVQDDRLGPGGVGVFVGGDYNEVALDHFSLQTPD